MKPEFDAAVRPKMNRNWHEMRKQDRYAQIVSIFPPHIVDRAVNTMESIYVYFQTSDAEDAGEMFIFENAMEKCADWERRELVLS